MDSFNNIYGDSSFNNENADSFGDINVYWKLSDVYEEEAKKSTSLESAFGDAKEQAQTEFEKCGYEQSKETSVKDFGWREDAPKFTDKQEDILLSPEEQIDLRCGGKLAKAVKSGYFLKDCMEISLYDTVERLYYERMEYICVGLINSEKHTQFTDSPTFTPRMTNRSYERIKPSSSYLSSGVSNKKSYKQHYVLDVYMTNEDAPYRVDSEYVNYRMFLKEIEYNVRQNFLKFLMSLSIKAVKSAFNGSAYSLLRNEGRVSEFSSIDAFMLECRKNRRNKSRLFYWSDIFG